MPWVDMNGRTPGSVVRWDAPTSTAVGTLPATGADRVVSLAGFGLAVLALGGVLVALTRREVSR